MNKCLAIASNWMICLAFGFTALSCSKSPESLNDLSFHAFDVESTEAAQLLAKGTVIVLDVRTPKEFALGHIPNAVNHNIRADGFEEVLDSLDHTKPYLVHCAGGVPGGRSRKAMEALKAAGATTAYHLDGGFVAWEAAGHPVE